MGVTHPSREECGRELMLMFHSNSKISTLIFVLFVSVKNLETLTRTIQTAVFFSLNLLLIHPALQYRCHCSTWCGCFHIHGLTSRPLDRSGCRSISPDSLCVLFMTCPCWLGSYSASKSCWGSIWAPFIVLTAGHWSQVRYTGAE